MRTAPFSSAVSAYLMFLSGSPPPFASWIFSPLIEKKLLKRSFREPRPKCIIKRTLLQFSPHVRSLSQINKNSFSFPPIFLFPLARPPNFSSDYCEGEGGEGISLGLCYGRSVVYLRNIAPEQVGMACLVCYGMPPHLGWKREREGLPPPIN